MFRVLNYPAQIEAPHPRQLRAGAHSDYGSLTIVRQDHNISCEAGSNRPGAEMMITYLSNIVFIQAVRAYLDSLKQQEEGGWLRALIDPQMSVALALIHQHPETSWTVAALAKQLNMSRSAFAAQFKELVGETPLQYITRWRMHCAVDLLRLDTTLADIAERVGYQSETAFSKVFKR